MDGDLSDKNRSERDKSSTADVEEVKDFVLTEDGTSAATPRHSTDLHRNILPDDADSDLLEQTLDTSGPAAEAPPADARRGKESPDPNAPTVEDSEDEEGEGSNRSKGESIPEALLSDKGRQDTNTSKDRSDAEDSGSDIEVGSLDFTGTIAGKRRNAEEEAAAAAAEQAEKERRAKAEDERKVKVEAERKAKEEQARKEKEEKEAQVRKAKEEKELKVKEELEKMQRQREQAKEDEAAREKAAAEALATQEEAARKEKEREEKEKEEAAAKAKAQEKRETVDTETKVEELEEIASVDVSQEAGAHETQEATAVEEVAEKLDAVQLVQELVLGKYDAERKVFEARFTHPLDAVKKGTLELQREVSSYLSSSLFPKQKAAKQLGVEVLPEAAMQKCVSLVQGDLLGASISGEQVDAHEIARMQRVCMYVCIHT